MMDVSSKPASEDATGLKAVALSRLQCQLGELQQHNSALYTENEVLKDKLNALQQTCDETLAKQAALQLAHRQQVAEMEDAMHSLKQQLSEARGSAEEQQGQVAAAREEVHAVLAGREKRCQELRAQVASLTKELTAKGSEADSLSRKLAAVNSLTSAFEQELEVLQQRMNALQERAGQQDAALKQHERRLLEVVQTGEGLAEQLDAQGKVLQTTQQKLAEQQAANSAADEAHAEVLQQLEQQLRQAKEQVDTCKQEAKSVEAQLQQEQQRGKEAAETLQQQLNTLEEKLAEATAEQQAAQAAAAAATAESEQAAADAAACTASLEAQRNAAVVGLAALWRHTQKQRTAVLLLQQKQQQQQQLLLNRQAAAAQNNLGTLHNSTGDTPLTAQATPELGAISAQTSGTKRARAPAGDTAAAALVLEGATASGVASAATVPQHSALQPHRSEGQATITAADADTAVDADEPAAVRRCLGAADDAHPAAHTTHHPLGGVGQQLQQQHDQQRLWQPPPQQPQGPIRHQQGPVPSALSALSCRPTPQQQLQHPQQHLSAPQAGSVAFSASSNSSSTYGPPMQGGILHTGPGGFQPPPAHNQPPMGCQASNSNSTRPAFPTFVPSKHAMQMQAQYRVQLQQQARQMQYTHHQQHQQQQHQQQHLHAPAISTGPQVAVSRPPGLGSFSASTTTAAAAAAAAFPSSGGCSRRLARTQQQHEHQRQQEQQQQLGPQSGGPRSGQQHFQPGASPAAAAAVAAAQGLHVGPPQSLRRGSSKQANAPGSVHGVVTACNTLVADNTANTVPTDTAAAAATAAGGSCVGLTGSRSGAAHVLRADTAAADVNADAATAADVDDRCSNLTNPVTTPSTEHCSPAARQQQLVYQDLAPVLATESTCAAAAAAVAAAADADADADAVDSGAVDSDVCVADTSQQLDQATTPSGVTPCITQSKAAAARTKAQHSAPTEQVTLVTPAAAHDPVKRPSQQQQQQRQQDQGKECGMQQQQPATDAGREAPGAAATPTGTTPAATAEAAAATAAVHNSAAAAAVAGPGATAGATTAPCAVLEGAKAGAAAAPTAVRPSVQSTMGMLFCAMADDDSDEE